ncbi:hypothetical protein K7432_016645 [Basidiobolus ranarum]|uniref:Uncharacterized protein n=1 Tax=Basidiobolus ranarum TaxID=34480 RepID=A0ABR2WEF9_9FUNG
MFLKILLISLFLTKTVRVVHAQNPSGENIGSIYSANRFTSVATLQPVETLSGHCNSAKVTCISNTEAKKCINGQWVIEKCPNKNGQYQCQQQSDTKVFCNRRWKQTYYHTGKTTATKTEVIYKTKESSKVVTQSCDSKTFQNYCYDKHNVAFCHDNVAGLLPCGPYGECQPGEGCRPINMPPIDGGGECVLGTGRCYNGTAALYCADSQAGYQIYPCRPNMECSEILNMCVPGSIWKNHEITSTKIEKTTISVGKEVKKVVTENECTKQIECVDPWTTGEYLWCENGKMVPTWCAKQAVCVDVLHRQWVYDWTLHKYNLDTRVSSVECQIFLESVQNPSPGSRKSLPSSLAKPTLQNSASNTISYSKNKNESKGESEKTHIQSKPSHTSTQEPKSNSNDSKEAKSSVSKTIQASSAPNQCKPGCLQENVSPIMVKCTNGHTETSSCGSGMVCVLFEGKPTCANTLAPPPLQPPQSSQPQIDTKSTSQHPKTEATEKPKSSVHNQESKTTEKPHSKKCVPGCLQENVSPIMIKCVNGREETSSCGSGYVCVPFEGKPSCANALPPPPPPPPQSSQPQIETSSTQQPAKSIKTEKPSSSDHHEKSMESEKTHSSEHPTVKSKETEKPSSSEHLNILP